jgi:hypothetical protein
MDALKKIAELNSQMCSENEEAGKLLNEYTAKIEREGK